MSQTNFPSKFLYGRELKSQTLFDPPQAQGWGGIYLGEPRDEARDKIMALNRIGNYELFTPLSVVVEYLDGEYIAKAPDLPQLYGCGDTMFDSVEMLKQEILALYKDLCEDDEFTAEWMAHKSFLSRIFIR